jgi:hypothetical protein
MLSLYGMRPGQCFDRVEIHWLIVAFIHPVLQKVQVPIASVPLWRAAVKNDFPWLRFAGHNRESRSGLRK